MLISCTEKKGFWLGLLSEHGGEGAPALIISLKQQAWRLGLESDRLMLIMHEHVALVSPVLQLQMNLTPKKKNQKSKI